MSLTGTECDSLHNEDASLITHLTWLKSPLPPLPPPPPPPPQFMDLHTETERGTSHRRRLVLGLGWGLTQRQGRRHLSYSSFRPSLLPSFLPSFLVPFYNISLIFLAQRCHEFTSYSIFRIHHGNKGNVWILLSSNDTQVSLMAFHGDS